jgi:hypothetical protein
VAYFLAGVLAYFPSGAPITVGLGCGLVAAGLFAWYSSASKTIALSTGTLLAAAFLFALQMRFELRSAETKDLLSVHYTIDRATRSVRQANFDTRDAVPRLGYEGWASNWLVENSPKVFETEDGRERLVLDLAVAEILYFFAHEEFDWQAVRVRLGPLTTAGRGSRPGQCTEMTPANYAQLMRNDSNVLSGMPMSAVGGSTCFPPQSSIALKGRVLTISNPFGTLGFEPFLSGSVSYIKPGRTTLDADALTQLADGKPQWETRVLGVRVTNQMGSLYSQHRDAAKYTDWRKRVVDSLANWFEHVEEPPGPRPLIAPTPRR